MPLFRFNLIDGASTFEAIETQLADRDTARVEAIRFAGELLRDRARQITVGETWCLEVVDENGSVIFLVDLKFPEPSVPALLQSI